MRIAATGFISEAAGSVASANAVFLKELLREGDEIDFFTKPSFVDPRPAVAGTPGAERLRVVDCTNRFGDSFRRMVSRWTGGWVKKVSEQFDSFTYYRSLVTAMRRHTVSGVDLWLGDWARGHGKRPVVSFVQGPPGTDARSVEIHRELIERLAGRRHYFLLEKIARWRLSSGLPCFDYSDHVILGSEWSRNQMIDKYHVPASRLHVIPYPIDLQTFCPGPNRRDSNERLRLLWLGRFVPRKRLDLFLDGLAFAIRSGCDVEAWVIGQSGFVPNYEKLIEEFPYPDRLWHRPSIPRGEVPMLLSTVDVMAQPSDEENFGSSVAEALACGLPVIVGKTNGTGDYICQRSVRLEDDRPETFAGAIVKLAEDKRKGILRDVEPSRHVAESHFDVIRLGESLRRVLDDAIRHPRLS